MKKDRYLPFEVSIHPITLEFSDISLEHEYREVCFRSFKIIAQIGLALIIMILGFYYSEFPQDSMLNKLIYVSILLLVVWSTAYVLERRQRNAFLKRKEAELHKTHITQALRRLSQQYS
jgi:hypothetical protein